jgi:LPS sulfotransferase NodH
VSTLRPGKVSQAIADLRDKAITEMNAIPDGVTRPEDLAFDREHDSVNATSNFDSENWVARYPGQNSPHIGNGSGGVR